MFFINFWLIFGVFMTLHDDVVLLSHLIRTNSFSFSGLKMDFGGKKWVFLVVLVSIIISVFSFSKIYIPSFKMQVWATGFAVSMFWLVSTVDLSSLPMPWDTLGVVSFYLVFWYFQSFSSFFSALKVFFYNRIGDCFLLIVLGGVLSCSSFEYFKKEWSGFFFIFFLLAMMTKSAIFPFSSWLISAMAAPTPISALVHSSTLVVAGLWVLKSYSQDIPLWVGLLGGMTCIGAGVGSFFDFDSKKIVAYSTLSQMGFLMLILTLGCKDQIFINYLIAHALFKALLFVSLGTAMMENSRLQDIRFINIKNCSFLTQISVLISSFCLSGLPFFSAFMLKDTWVFHKSLNSMMVSLLVILCLLSTQLYSFRFVYLLFKPSLMKMSWVYETKSNDWLVFLPLYFDLFCSASCSGMLQKVQAFFWQFLFVFSCMNVAIFFVLQSMHQSSVFSSLFYHHNFKSSFLYNMVDSKFDFFSNMLSFCSRTLSSFKFKSDLSQLVFCFFCMSMCFLYS